SVQVLDAAITHPDRGGGMRLDRSDASAASSEHRVPAARVDDPFGGNLDLLPVLSLDRDGISRAVAELDAGDASRPPDLRAFLGGQMNQMLIELRAVELEGRGPRELRRPDFRGVAQALHIVVDEPVAERLFGKLVA